MPPKVEAVVLAAVLVGAWILMENSHRIDISADDQGSWTTVATCQPFRMGTGYSVSSALAAEAENTALLSVARSGDGSDACGSAYQDYSAAASGTVSALP